MTTDTNFGVTRTKYDNVTVIAVSGEIDVSTAPELRDKLASLDAEAGATAVVDLSEVSFVDSTALGVLVSAVKRLRSSGGDLKLVVTKPHITKVLEITGLTEVFEIYASPEEAVAA